MCNYFVYVYKPRELWNSFHSCLSSSFSFVISEPPKNELKSIRKKMKKSSTLIPSYVYKSPRLMVEEERAHRRVRMLDERPVER